jgi:Ni/Co efflux regulator RcnB
MTTNRKTALRRIGLISGTGLIAISVSALPITHALAGAVSGDANQQVAEAQGQPKNPLPPSQQQNQKNHQQGGWLQYRQGGQSPNQQGGQQPYQQNGQKGGQPQYQQGGPPPNQQWGQQQYQQGWQQGGQPQYQQGQQQYQQGGPPPNQPWGQPQYRQGQRYDWGTYQPGHQPPQWSQYNHNFDPRPYQWNQYADHSYRGQPYQPPRGWYDRRWAYGQILPAPFWARNYWMVNYWGFGLVDPPYGYVWVRYGNDALMVNIITGQILGSVYWLFY